MGFGPTSVGGGGLGRDAGLVRLGLGGLMGQGLLGPWGGGGGPAHRRRRRLDRGSPDPVWWRRPATSSREGHGEASRWRGTASCEEKGPLGRRIRVLGRRRTRAPSRAPWRRRR